MNRNDAIESTFLAGEELETVRGIFSTATEEPVDAIVVFTGYGHELARHAVSLASKSPKVPVFILGPDSNPWKKDPDADADNYREYIGASFTHDEIDLSRVIADSSSQTSFTPGQARTLAKWLVSRRDGGEDTWKRVALVTAAYHQPRAYLTTLQALFNYRLDKDVALIAAPVGIDDWKAPDPNLKGNASWLSSLQAEREKILSYQRKGHVATWKAAKEYLGL